MRLSLIFFSFSLSLPLSVLLQCTHSRVSFRSNVATSTGAAGDLLKRMRHIVAAAPTLMIYRLIGLIPHSSAPLGAFTPFPRTTPGVLYARIIPLSSIHYVTICIKIEYAGLSDTDVGRSPIISHSWKHIAQEEIVKHSTASSRITRRHIIHVTSIKRKCQPFIFQDIAYFMVFS